MVPIVDAKIGIQVSTTSDEVTASFDDFRIIVPEAPSVYGPRIGQNLEAEMFNQNSSVYTRIPFSVTGDPSQFDELNMTASYDDGFRAFLNGEEIVAENVPVDATWNSDASSRFGATGGQISLDTIDLTGALQHLREGDNVLAIHGMNVDRGDSDFFLESTLSASKTVPAATQIFVTPSPGEANLLRAAQPPTIVGQQGGFFGTARG